MDSELNLFFGAGLLEFTADGIVICSAGEPEGA